MKDYQLLQGLKHLRKHSKDRISLVETYKREKKPYPDQRKMSLRLVVGVLSVERAQLRDGVKLTERLEFEDDEVPMRWKGTPGRPAAAESFRRLDKTVTVARQFSFAEIHAHDSISEAVCKLCCVLKSSATPQAISLALAIAQCLEKYETMSGFSSCVTAAACISFAASAFDMEMLLSGGALKRLGVLAGPLRIAYNQLWLHKKLLEPQIVDRGGDPTCLPLPRNAKGDIDIDILRRGYGLEVKPGAKEHRRRRGPRCGPSSLRIVTSVSDVPEADVKPENIKETCDEDLMPEESRSSDDSWELDSSSSDASS